MPISDSNRRLFEGVGLSALRRELAVGSILYLGTADDSRRAEALEWLIEQDVKAAKKADAQELEANINRHLHGRLPASALPCLQL